MINKKLFLLLVVFTLACAEDNYELKLYETVLPLIFTKTPIKIYTDTQETAKIFQQSRFFYIVPHCDHSVELLVGNKFGHLSPACADKPLFSTTYKSFKMEPNSFGAFYWRKGRPQIKFKTKTLHRYHLILPKTLQRYAR